MSKRMKDLVAALEAINFNPPNKDFNHILSIFKSGKSDHGIKDDNYMASCIVTIISLVPAIMNHPKNNALKELCIDLKTEEITLSPTIKSRLFEGTHLKRSLAKTRPHRHK